MSPRRSGFGQLISAIIEADPELQEKLGLRDKDTRSPEEKATHDRIEASIIGTIRTHRQSFSSSRDGLLELRKIYGEVIGLKGADDDLITMIKKLDESEQLLRALVEGFDEKASAGDNGTYARDFDEPPF